MTLLSRFMVVFGALILSVAQARAWNSTGHMTVAELAWRNLSTVKRNAISALLKQHPHYTLLLIKKMDPNADPDEWVFLTAATWPDLVRPARPGQPPKPPEVTKYHHAAWHFVDFPYLWPADVAHFDAHQLAPPVTNALWAISNAIITLKDAHAAASERALSLCWLLHLVGDIHQPLHCATMYSDAYPNGDKGGNALALAEAGHKPTPLHTLWDDLLGTTGSYHFIDNVADGLDSGTTYDAIKQKNYRNHKTYQSWATESFAAARTFAYDEGSLQFAKWSDFESHKISDTDVPVLTSAYENRANDIASRRIALAGKRLADVLKKLF